MFDAFDNIFIWAQVVGFIAMAINASSWQLKNSRHIILCYIPGSSLWAVQYLLLGAPLGAIMNICSAFKDTALFTIRDAAVPYIIGGFLFAVWSLGLYFTNHWFDILPLLAGTITNLSLLQRDNRALISRACLAAQLCWMFYTVIVGAYMGLACSTLVSVSTIMGMYRHENWKIEKCYRSFLPGIIRELFIFPSFRKFS